MHVLTIMLESYVDYMGVWIIIVEITWWSICVFN